MLRSFATILVLVALSACQTTTTTPSNTRAVVDVVGLNEAKIALDACARFAPNVGPVVTKLKSQGLVSTTQANTLAAIAKLPDHQFLTILENQHTGLRVRISSSSAKETGFGCDVTLAGMTGEQAVALAEPLIRKYNADTKTRNGHFQIGARVLQEWRGVADRNYTRIAVLPSTSWGLAKGAEIRFAYATKPSGSSPFPALTYTLN